MISKNVRYVFIEYHSGCNPPYTILGKTIETPYEVHPAIFYYKFRDIHNEKVRKYKESNFMGELITFWVMD